MKRMSLIFLNIVLIGIAQASQAFSGVIETMKSEPIANVKISLQEKNNLLSTETNAQGKFVFAAVTPGKYFLTAEKKDVLTFAESTMISKNDTQPMQITMLPIEFAVFHYLPVHMAYS